LVEDLDAVVAAVADKQPPARVHRQRMRTLRVEITRSGALLPPRLDERAVLRELHDARVRRAAVAVADEDVAVGRHEHRGGNVERIAALAGDTRRPERHQQLPVGTELEDLVSFSVPARILPVGAFAVGDPDVAVAVDVNAVRPHEHARAEALDESSCRVEFLDRRDVGADAVLIAAAIERPDAPPVAIDGDAGRGADFSARGKLEEVFDELIGRPFGPGVVREQQHDDRSQHSPSPHGERHTSPPVHHGSRLSTVIMYILALEKCKGRNAFEPGPCRGERDDQFHETRRRYAAAEPTPEEAKDAITGYLAYFGTYSVDEQARIVTHHRTCSINPGQVGDEVVRAYVFESNDRLVLTPAG